MGHVIVFNLIKIFEDVWVPEAWLAELDRDAQPKDLLRRISQNQFQEWKLQADDYVLKLIEWSEKLQLGALDQYFGRTVRRKRVSITELWEDRDIRQGIEKYITRHLDQFFQLAQRHAVWLSKDAEQKPILAHHILTFAPDPADGFLHLTKNESGLLYRMEIRNQTGDLFDNAHIQPLAFTTPAWFVYRGSIYRLPGINGKMLLPFRQKSELVVSKQHEKTWFHQFLKRNIDRDAQVVTEGFLWEEYQSLSCAQISIFRHLFDGRLLLRLQFEYPETIFTLGDRQVIRSKIIIPDADQEEVRILKIIRNEKQESRVIQRLQEIGLCFEFPHFYFPEVHKLEQLVDQLQCHRSALQAEGIFCDWVHPDSGKSLALDPPSIRTHSSKTGDWFDLEMDIEIGNMHFPFRRIIPAIRNREEVFPLADGSVFIIPESWFTRYHELADYLASQEDESTDENAPIRLHTIQDHLLTALDAVIARPIQDAGTTILPEWLGQNWLQAELRPYQRYGVQWVLHCWQEGLGACLADDMGLGKTLQTIAALVHFKQLKKEKIQPEPENLSSPACQLSLFDQAYTQTILPLQALIIVPASLVHNWSKELEHFAPDLFVYRHVGPKRGNDRRAILAHDVVLTTYHTLREDADWMVTLAWEFVVLDESQHIKNHHSDISRTVRQMQSPRKLALSGTPIENSLSELWSLFNFLNPPLLGSHAGFKKQFLIPIEKDGEADRKAKLGELIKPYFLRRRKKEVAPELPSLTRQVLWIDMDEEQQDLYERTKSAARNELLAIEKEGDYRFHALRILMKLRQIACHPGLIDPDTNSPGKMTAVLEEYNQLKEQGNKVLVFSTFEQHLKWYRSWLEAQGHAYAWLSGSSSTRERQQSVERFQEDPDVQIFLITLKAGGTGLNLTAADYVFILDPWWNPQAEEQAIARAHRIGREKPVHVIRFISSGTIEEKILQLQAEKWELGLGILDDELPPLTKEDLLKLL